MRLRCPGAGAGGGGRRLTRGARVRSQAKLGCCADTTRGGRSGGASGCRDAGGAESPPAGRAAQGEAALWHKGVRE